LKLWDLSTQHCVQTVVAHRAEVWSLSLNSEQDLLLTGSNEGELKAWKIEPGALMDGIKESENGEVWHNFECSEIVLTHLLYSSQKRFTLYRHSLSLHSIASLKFHFTLLFRIFLFSLMSVLWRFSVCVLTMTFVRSMLVGKKRADAKAAMGKGEKIKDVPDNEDS
jgi:WD40 repeat protein